VRLVYELLDGVGLEELLGVRAVRAELEGAMSMLSAPDRCYVGRLAEGGCRGPAGEALPVEEAFELRAFTAERELRWTRTAKGGRALLISEERGAGLGEPVEVEVERLGEQRYLLNGLRDERRTRPGWTTLSASHVASISVPFETTAVRVQLVAVEYIRRDPEHGNVYVCEERLTELRPAPAVETKVPVGT